MTNQMIRIRIFSQLICLNRYVCVYVSMHVCSYVGMYMYACMYVWVDGWMDGWMYMYVDGQICRYEYLNT